jgi:hypothetical protein
MAGAALPSQPVRAGGVPAPEVAAAAEPVQGSLQPAAERPWAMGWAGPAPPRSAEQPVPIVAAAMVPASVWVVAALSAERPPAVRLWAMGWAGSALSRSAERQVPIVAAAMVPALVWVVMALSAVAAAALVWAWPESAAAAARRQGAALAGWVSRSAVVPATHVWSATDAQGSARMVGSWIRPGR